MTFREEQRNNPDNDPRHFDKPGRLPRLNTPPEIKMPGVQGWLLRSIYPIVKADAKRPLALATAVALAAVTFYLGLRIGHAEGFIEGARMCLPAAPSPAKVQEKAKSLLDFGLFLW